LHKDQNLNNIAQKMELPIEDMIHIYDEGRTKISMGDLFGIAAQAEARLTEKNNSVALTE